jgi:hypothetical protein
VRTENRSVDGSIPPLASTNRLPFTVTFIRGTPGSKRELAHALSFAIVAARIFRSEELLPTAVPLPFFGYPVLILTFVG